MVKIAPDKSLPQTKNRGQRLTLTNAGQRDDSARWSHGAPKAHPGQPGAAAMNARRGGSAPRASKNRQTGNRGARGEAGVPSGSAAVVVEWDGVAMCYPVRQPTLRSRKHWRLRCAFVLLHIRSVLIYSFLQPYALASSRRRVSHFAVLHGLLGAHGGRPWGRHGLAHDDAPRTTGHAAAKFGSDYICRQSNVHPPANQRLNQTSDGRAPSRSPRLRSTGRAYAAAISRVALTGSFSTLHSADRLASRGLT
jgi:hypothetical protein